MNEWQPIKTAPKDGTAVWIVINGQPYIGYYDPPNYFGPGQWFAKASFRRRRDMSDDIYGTYAHGVEPTHWMPLPEPPK